MNSSYIMIKPDGLRYLNQIERMVLQGGFEINGRYSVTNWEKVAHKVYEKCIRERDELFEKEFLCHIWLNKYLFGNYAIVLILKKDKCYDKILLEEIMKVKSRIRTNFNASKNGTFIIALDMKKIDIPSESIERGYLSIATEDEIKVFDSTISQKGMFNSFFLQYVHCPDANIEDAKNELGILCDMNVISFENKINDDEWNMMKKLNERLDIES